MKKPNFLNKIATFYPTNSKNGNGSPIFYINYDNAPLTIELYLNCVLAGLTPEKSYIVHLNILSDDGTTKVDTDNYITGQDMFEGNYIKDILGEEGDAIQLLYQNYGDSNCVVKENTIINASRRFIKLQCSKVKVERNTLKEQTDVIYAHPSQSIDIQYGSDIEILDNNVYTQQLNSIYINGTDSSNLSENITIKGNDIEINAKNYLYCKFAKNVTVEGNSFKKGVMFTFDNCSEFRIYNNSITSKDNTSSPLFRLLSSNSNFVIERNILKAGVYLWLLENKSPFLVFKDNTALSDTPGFRTFDTAIQSIYVYNVIGGKTIQYGGTTQQLFENNYSKDSVGDWV